jgi:hypothetical protein
MFALCSDEGKERRMHPRTLTPLALETRFDGPIPPAEPGADPVAPCRSGGHLFQRLAAERRAAIADRRNALTARRACADPVLARWCGALRLYRGVATAE